MTNYLSVWKLDLARVHQFSLVDVEGGECFGARHALALACDDFLEVVKRAERAGWVVDTTCDAAMAVTNNLPILL